MLMPSSADRHWGSETDLLIVGAGAAGMTAAMIGTLASRRNEPCAQRQTC